MDGCPLGEKKSINIWQGDNNKMPLCPDCRQNDGILSVMIYVRDEEVIKRGRKVIYCVVECLTCGSSLRFPKNVKQETTPQ